jgi:hypothetical protein
LLIVRGDSRDIGDGMTTVEEGLRSQLRNIEATYGRAIEAWVDVIRASGRTRHRAI